MNLNRTVRMAAMGLVVSAATGACHKSLVVLKEDPALVSDLSLKAISTNPVAMSSITTDAGVSLQAADLSLLTTQYTNLGACARLFGAAAEASFFQKGDDTGLILRDASGNMLLKLYGDIGRDHIKVRYSSEANLPLIAVDLEGNGSKRIGPDGLNRVTFTCSDSLTTTVAVEADKDAQYQSQDQKQAVVQETTVVSQATVNFAMDIQPKIEKCEPVQAQEPVQVQEPKQAQQVVVVKAPVEQTKPVQAPVQQAKKSGGKK